MLYSETEAHLVNLERCGSRPLRVGYLALVIAAERAGFRAAARAGGEHFDVRIRDRADRQPFMLVVERDALLFDIRRPALEVRPELAGQAQVRFAGRLAGEGPGGSGITIRVTDDRDAEDLGEWLFGTGAVAVMAQERWYG